MPRHGDAVYWVCLLAAQSGVCLCEFDVVGRARREMDVFLEGQQLRCALTAAVHHGAHRS